MRHVREWPMTDWLVVIGLVAFAVVVIVRHERRSRRRMRADHQQNWWARRVQERDYFVEKGTQLWLGGVIELAPQNFDSKWEHARATHRFLLGGADISYGVDIGAKRSRPTIAVDDVVHHVALLHHDGCVVPVLMCNLDQWVDEQHVVDDGQPTTCFMCAVASVERYER